MKDTNFDDLVFKHFQTNEIVNVKEHVKNFLHNNPGTLVTVGSDSLSHKKWTVYGTIIAMFYPTYNGKTIEYHKGAHLIYTKKRVPKIKDLFTRLWNEIELTQKVADYVEVNVFNTDLENNIRNLEIHIDINPNEDYKSNVLFKSAMGMFTSMGYEIKAKPESWVASTAADSIVKN